MVIELTVTIMKIFFLQVRRHYFDFQTLLEIESKMVENILADIFAITSGAAN